MAKQQKIVLAVLVLLVAVFVAAVVVGQHRSDDAPAAGAPNGPTAKHTPIPEFVRSLIRDPAAVGREDLRADCFEPAHGQRLVIRGSCTLEVAAGKSGLRLVRLHTASAITVASRAPNNDFVIEDDVRAGSDLTVAVDADPSAIEFSCGFGATCVLALVGGGS